MDLKIFVLTDDDVRLARRLKRDIAERGRDIEDILRQYNRFVKPSYEEFIKPTMKYADIIIPHGRSNTIAIDFVVNNLRNRIPDYDFLTKVASPLPRFLHKVESNSPRTSDCCQIDVVKIPDESKLEKVEYLLT
jgi:Phosphoribulokinase / Uridine kinase family